MTSSAATSADFSRTETLTGLQRSVLLAVLYADLFDFPLTEDELRKRLVLRRVDPAALRACVRSLKDRYLTAVGPYVVWHGREHLVDVRRRRTAASKELWPYAVKYAEWLSRIPYMRMVAVSGSLAVDNADTHSDVDLFCITEKDRLWMVRLFIVALSKMTRLFPRLFPRYLCPNYILASDALSLSDRNLYTAHEVAQARPLYGADVHADFLRANRWVREFLPDEPDEVDVQLKRGPSAAARLFERVLAGRLGDWIDDAIYHAFRTFYRRRALRHGWPWRSLEPAYQRSRYAVPENGYVPIVRRLLTERIADRLGPSFPAGDMRRLFPDDYPPCGESCYDWEGQFRRDYGGERSDSRTSPGMAPGAGFSNRRKPSIQHVTPA